MKVLSKTTNLRVFIFCNIVLTTVFVPGSSLAPYYKTYSRQRNKSNWTGFKNQKDDDNKIYKWKRVNSFNVHEIPWNNFDTFPSENNWSLASNKIRRRNFQSLWKMDMECDGRSNLLQDLGILAIVTGAVGTLMGIFSASYYSILGNVISVINAILSFATGIPSAVITYLAASDRVSYTAANILGLLGIANTFYGMWSIDIGNKDILLSQTGNLLGVFSLILSLLTTFPKVFDQLVKELKSFSPQSKREIGNFINFYGCSGKPTYFSIFDTVIRYGINWILKL